LFATFEFLNFYTFCNNVKLSDDVGVVMNQTVSGAQKELIEQAAQVIATDNAELATAFLQKTAVEKAIPEIDKRLTNVRALIDNHLCYISTRFCILRVIRHCTNDSESPCRSLLYTDCSDAFAEWCQHVPSSDGFLSPCESALHP